MSTNGLAVCSNNSEVKLSSTFTRPANTTAYAAGQLLANNTVAASVIPLSFANAARQAGDCVRLDRARVYTSSTSLVNASFRIHIFETLPVPTVGDAGAFNASNALATTGMVGYVGSFSVTLSQSGSDGASGRGLPDVGGGLTVAPTTNNTFYALIEVLAAYTPTSGETITVSLEGYRP